MIRLRDASGEPLLSPDLGATAGLYLGILTQAKARSNGIDADPELAMSFEQFQNTSPQRFAG